MFSLNNFESTFKINQKLKKLKKRVESKKEQLNKLEFKMFFY